MLPEAKQKPDTFYTILTLRDVFVTRLDLRTYIESYNISKTHTKWSRKYPKPQYEMSTNQFPAILTFPTSFVQFLYNMHTYGCNMNTVCIKALRPGVALPPAARHFERRHLYVTPKAIFTNVEKPLGSLGCPWDPLVALGKMLY